MFPSYDHSRYTCPIFRTRGVSHPTFGHFSLLLTVSAIKPLASRTSNLISNGTVARTASTFKVITKAGVGICIAMDPSESFLSTPNDKRYYFAAA
jgi:hypothetical protein